MDLKQKLCLITGASRGLGAAIALEIAKQQGQVIAVARTIGALEEMDDQIQNLGGAATLVPLDITARQGVQQLGASLHERWGGIDLWVHTAIHAAPLTPANHIDSKDLQKSIDINLTASQALIESIDPLLRAKQGQAIYVTDPHATGKFFGAYGATKSAQIALFQHWAAEMRAAKLNVTGFDAKPMPTATRARFYPGEDRSKLTPCATEAKRLLTALKT
ncbi:MAG: SDR family oxidoreductase [Pseudomonadota bacterium]